MSEETKTLKIFESLKTYFNILCLNNCTNYNECDELMNILTREKCEPTGEFTKNFLAALSSFAVELKKADSPIGLYTIKNKLKLIFENPAYDINDVNYVNTVTNDINQATDLNGFKMDQDNGEGKTYQELLSDIVKHKPEPTKIFGLWLHAAFPLYFSNITYFKEHVKPIIMHDKFDQCQKKLLNTYFDVVSSDGVYSVSVDDYIDKKSLQNNDVRLNAKTNPDKTAALIVQILPEDVREDFNKFLITPLSGSPVFYANPGCKSAKYKLTSTEPIKTEFKVQDPKKVLDWFANETKGSRSQGIKEEVKEEDLDHVDNEPYEDENNSKFMFPTDFENIVNYKDNWRADIRGRLWKKDEKTGKFVEFTNDEITKDVSLFQTLDGNCGKLCIFNNPAECTKFFEKMMKKDSLSMEELSDIINSPHFVKNYNKLKENIVGVNPIFVKKTLKLFGFEEYNELKANGTKVVRIESFNRWWNRHKDKLINLTGTTHKNNPAYDPEPPANLELFFKLLILYINNNEFVLNPQTKQYITSNQEVSVKKIKPSEKVWVKDKDGNPVQIVNPHYKKELATYEGRTIQDSRPESLSNLLDMMRKNSHLGPRTVSMKDPENRLNLNSMLGLMIGVTTDGHIRLSKEPPYSTGKGYLYGGNDKPQLLPCSKNATEIYSIGVDTLKKKNKTLSDNEKKLLDEQLLRLAEFEHEVYKKLYVLANYVKVINVMDDDAQNDAVTIDMMDKAIQDYESASSKLATKSDSTISVLLKKLYDGNNEPKSYYSKLY